MRYSIVILLLFFSGISLKAQSPAEKYVNKFDSLAVDIMKNYGIPASVVLGIALQESGAGTSKLCRINHNHFGVRGRVKSSKTKSGYKSSYRSFESDEVCYKYFCEMVSSKKYYPVLKGNMDYMKWLKAMKAAKYASSPSWIVAVDKLIKRYDLTRFDIPISENQPPVFESNDSIPTKQ
jgi:Bax protein